MRRPQLPANFFKFSAHARLKAVQQFICSFEYKHTPQTSFNAHKFRPLIRIMDTAKLMIYSPQPIKCVEAVFLAIYLTSDLVDVERIPLGFKTLAEGQVHRHIVLLVRHAGKFGAFGISRHPDLMNKELKFESISSIVENFVTAYQHSLHMVLKVRVGLPVEHNVESRNYVCWRSLSLDLTILMWQQCCEALEKHAAQAKQLWKKWLLEGKRSGTQLTFGLPQKVEPNDPDDVAASKRTDTVSRQPGTIQSAVTAARTCSKISEHYHRKKTCPSNFPPHKMLHSVPKRHARKDGMSNLSLCRGSVAAAAAKEPLISLNKVASCSNNTKKNKRANASATFAQRKFPLKYHSIELLSTTGITRIPAFFC